MRECDRNNQISVRVRVRVASPRNSFGSGPDCDPRLLGKGRDAFGSDWVFIFAKKMQPGYPSHVSNEIDSKRSSGALMVQGD